MLSGMSVESCAGSDWLDSGGLADASGFANTTSSAGSGTFEGGVEGGRFLSVSWFSDSDCFPGSGSRAGSGRFGSSSLFVGCDKFVISDKFDVVRFPRFYNSRAGGFADDVSLLVSDWFCACKSVSSGGFASGVIVDPSSCATGCTADSGDSDAAGLVVFVKVTSTGDLGVTLVWPSKSCVAS